MIIITENGNYDFGGYANEKDINIPVTEGLWFSLEPKGSGSDHHYTNFPEGWSLRHNTHRPSQLKDPTNKTMDITLREHKKIFEIVRSGSIVEWERAKEIKDLKATVKSLENLISISYREKELLEKELEALNQTETDDDVLI